jgi:hypothetical protein
MNTFACLLMGHLLGDWLLQNDWMANGKKQGLFTLAGTVHFAIYTATTMGALWLSGVTDKNAAFYLILSAIIVASHWLIDAMDVARRWMRFYRQSDLEIVRLMVDQTLHVLVLVLVAGLFGGVK